MYRQAAERVPERAELVYRPRTTVDGARGLAIGAVVGVPIVAMTAVSVLVAPAASVPAFGAALAAMVAWYRRRPRPDVRLEIVDRVLTVRAARGSTAIPLDDLLDVALDKEEVARIEEGTSATTALRAVAVRTAETGPRHVLLVRRSGPPLPLGDAPILEGEATEWMGKVRAFLRRSDWLPEDERAPASSVAPPSSSEA